MAWKWGFILGIVFTIKCSATNIGVLVNERTINSTSLANQLKQLNNANEVYFVVNTFDKRVCNCENLRQIFQNRSSDYLVLTISSNSNILPFKNGSFSRVATIYIDKYMYIFSRNYRDRQLTVALSSLLLSGKDWVVLMTVEEMPLCLYLNDIVVYYMIKIRCIVISKVSAESEAQYMIQYMKGFLFRILVVTQSTEVINIWLKSAANTELVSSLYQWVVVTKSCNIWVPQQLMNLSIVCDPQRQTVETYVVSDIKNYVQSVLQNSTTIGQVSQTSLTLLAFGKCFDQNSFFTSKIWSDGLWTSVNNDSCRIIRERITMRICIALEAPFLYNVSNVDTTSSMTKGYLIEILKYLESRQLVNFQIYKVENFSLCISDIQSQKTAVAIGRDVSVNYNLKSFFRTETIYWEAIQIFAHKPENDSKLWNILRPLHYHVWLLCILSCIISAFTGVLLSKYSPLSAWNLGLDISIVDEVSFVENLWSYIGASLMQGQDFYPYSISSRIVLAIWWLFILIMSNVYSADLTSYLTISSGMKKSSSLDELLINPNYILYIVENSRAHKLINNSSDPKYINLINKIRLEKNIDICVQNVLNSTNSACIGDASPLIRYATRNCSIAYMVDEYIEWQPLSFIFPSNSTMKDSINAEIKLLIEIGLLDKWKTDYWLTGDAFDAECNPNFSSSILGLQDIGGTFILTFLLFGIGSLILVIEFTIYYVCKRKTIDICDESICISRPK